MIYPGTQDSYSMGSASGSDENKRKLVQQLMASRGGTQSARSAPLFGGRGRGSSDLPSAALPAISYNPFLAMLAGRANENFDGNMPSNISGEQASAAQNGPGFVQGAGAAQDAGQVALGNPPSPGQLSGGGQQPSQAPSSIRDFAPRHLNDSYSADGSPSMDPNAPILGKGLNAWGNAAANGFGGMEDAVRLGYYNRLR